MGVAVALASLALAAGDKVPEAPIGLPNIVPAVETAKAQSVEPTVLKITAQKITIKPGEKEPRYWYGLPSELKVVKHLGNTANAKLTYAIAKKQPWYNHTQMYCLDRLWYRESKFDEHAHNPRSGAHGIPQALPGSKMAVVGRNWWNSARTQIRWGINRYIERRYRKPCSAWWHSQSTGWY